MRAANSRCCVVACLAFVAIALVPGCQGWSYGIASSFGPTYWPQYFPQCNATAFVQSPIAFTTADEGGASVSYRLSFHRLVDTTVAAEAQAVSFVTMLNAGGLLEATPGAAFPMRVLRFSNAGALVSSDTKYLVKIAFHAGVEHAFNVSVAPTVEVQYLFADTATGPPTVVFCQRAREVDTTTVDNSVAYTVLSRVAAYASATARGGSTTNTADAYAPLFLNSSSTTSTRSIVYEGRTTYPPCTAVTTIVSTDVFNIPRATYRGMVLSGNSISTVRPLQNRTAVVTLDHALVTQGNAVNASDVLLNTPAPTQYVDVYTQRIVPNAKNEYMMDAIVALVATNGCLLLAIAILLMARWEYIEWPMWLGGLRRPVEWWTNPRSAGGDAFDEEEEDEEEEAEEECEEVSEGEGAAAMAVAV